LDWVQYLSNAIAYIEEHLTEELRVEDIAGQSYASGSHFQLVFHLVMGISVGEYIRNRRLSLAAQDLLAPGNRISDVSSRYRYVTQESFSKAFTRFHGVPPSKVRQTNIRFFYPLTINVTVKGGFQMSNRFIDEFCWSGLADSNEEDPSPTKIYQRLVNWAANARRQNPDVFDALTEWLLDDSEWTEDKLAENEQVLMQGVFARFRDQNSQLRAHLMELAPSGVVNDAVFQALDRFDDELSGKASDARLRETVASVFDDFSLMQKRRVRELVAGGKTGSFCTDSVELYGYINYLKDLDATVQWALFMPDKVENQQKGFRLDSFEYKKLPKMRFIGLEAFEGDEPNNREAVTSLFSCLDGLSTYQSEIAFDIFLVHHFGLGVDVGQGHGFWGRFMKADTPVPEGLVFFDFVPEHTAEAAEAGPPFLSQFAYAVFNGDAKAMHSTEGYDANAMYDITRNTMLGQGVVIPYPDKYWTAEVFIDGHENPSTAYMFSAEL